MGTLTAHDAWRDTARADLSRRRAGLDADTLRLAGERVADALEPMLRDLAATGPRPVVAGYAAVRGELPVDAALARARRLGAVTALPVTRGTAMRFAAFDDTTPLRAGRFGIAVPDVAMDGPLAFDPVELDLVLVPLLGFDARLDRLGMGGGFYDRAFAHRAGRAPGRPRLVGVAHGFQRVADVHAMAWDVPLDAVVTESGLTLPGA